MEKKLLKLQEVSLKMKQAAWNDAIDIMKHWQDFELAQFLFEHQELSHLWANSAFNSFWLEKLNSLRISSNSSFRFLEQPGVPTSELVSGYYIFCHWLRHKTSFKWDALPELSMSFHLTRKKMHYHLLDLIYADEKELLKFTKYLYNHEGFAKAQGTPGYLLLTNGYYHLACAYKRLHNNQELCEQAYKLCWKFMHLAQLAEKDSTISIHNAYYGKGLYYATPFKINNMIEMKVAFFSEVGSDWLTLTGQKSAENSAEFAYQNVLRARGDFKGNGAHP